MSGLYVASQRTFQDEGDALTTIIHRLTPNSASAYGFVRRSSDLTALYGVGRFKADHAG